MNREEKFLLHLLGTFVDQKEPLPCPEADWDVLQNLAHSHNVLGILGYMVTLWPICPDPERKNVLRTAYRRTLFTYADRNHRARQLSSALSESGIDHVVMKGFVLRNIYPVPELRTFGDVDLVIRQEDRQRCHDRMVELGYSVQNDWEPVYSYRKPGEYYEIHTEIMEVDVSDRADYRGYFRNLWSHTVPVEGHCLQFRPEFHFLYLLTHIAKHVVGSGAGVRMYLDLAVFLKHYGGSLDWDWIRLELKNLALEEFAGTALSFVEQHWGIKSPLEINMPGPEVVAAFTEFTVAGGIFGREARDGGTNTLAGENRSGGDVSRTAAMVRRLFPGAKSIENRYTYLQKKPWLLPAAWVHRLVKTREDWGKHAREVREILAADKEEAQALNRFYRDIGL